jgi:hypothetical protein
MSIPAYKIETVTLGYCVVTNTDLTEGKGAQYVVYHCVSRTTATRMARRAGVMGGPAAVEPFPLFRVLVDGTWHKYGPVSVYQPTREDEAADKRRMEFEAAIKRAREIGMTDEEIAALGGFP